jgi:hypothetical protein
MFQDLTDLAGGNQRSLILPAAFHIVHCKQ